MAVTEYGAGADTSRFQLRYFEETEWGKTPGTDADGEKPKFKDLRSTGESLTMNESSTQSNEIRSDRSITDLIRTGFEATGDINFEASAETFDPFFASALMGEWSEAINITTTVTIAGTAPEMVITDEDATGEFGAFVVGQWVKLDGLPVAAENGAYRIKAVAADTITVDATLTPEANVLVDLSTKGMVRNGVAVHSFSLEKEFADVGEYFLFQGMMVSALALEFGAENVLTGSFSFLGKDGLNGKNTYGDGAPEPAPATPVMNAVNHLTSLREAGVSMAEARSFVSSLSLNLDNALRGQKAIGDAGNVGVGLGRVNVTGSMETYFVSGALYTKFINEQETSLDWTITDREGNKYVFTLPRVKLTNPNITAGGTDQDVLATFDYQALRDPETGATIQIDRL